jgi:regulator of CtrA degradation
VSNTINLAEKFADSNKFNKLFQDGMSLVEESAAYLDGDGRANAKGLPRASAMLYGSESMRLTTRLMQLASWLLLQRAVNDGEMTREQILEEKKKIKLEENHTSSDNPAWSTLPAGFIDLVTRSYAQQNRVFMLDAELYGIDKDEVTQETNPVIQQLDLLSTAFGAQRQQ